MVAAVIGALPFLVAADEGDKGAEPIGRRSWFQDADYPFSAWLQAHQGMSEVSVTVNEMGRPIECKITKSSGHEELDDAACNGMLERASFKPAQKAGKPIVTIFSDRINWELPFGLRPSVSDEAFELPPKLTGDNLQFYKCTKAFFLAGSHDRRGEFSPLYAFSIPYYLGKIRGSVYSIDVLTLVEAPFWFRSVDEAKDTLTTCRDIAKRELGALVPKD